MSFSSCTLSSSLTSALHMLHRNASVLVLPDSAAAPYCCGNDRDQPSGALSGPTGPPLYPAPARISYITWENIGGLNNARMQARDPPY